jgi:uncharacterized protein YciI
MPLFVMTAEFLTAPRPDLFEQHIAWLTTQFEAGVFLVSGQTEAVGERPAMPLAIMEAASRDEALTILDSEPLFRAGVIRHDVAPWSPRVRTTDLDERFDGPDLLRVVPRA